MERADSRTGGRRQGEELGDDFRAQRCGIKEVAAQQQDGESSRRKQIWEKEG